MAKAPTLLPYALYALEQGFHIFPVEPGGKTPARLYQERSPEDAPWTIKWSEVATNDRDQVIKWWTYAPMANIGIACKPSGLFVVDCDRAKIPNILQGTPYAQLHDEIGEMVDGEILFDFIAERYGGTGKQGWAALHTYQVHTGSGGIHFYYRWPEDVQSSQDSIVRGLLDVRGNGGERGGYVLGDGSITNKGRYVKPGTNYPILPAPSWLVSLCRYKEPYRPPRSEVFARPKPVAFHGLVETVRNAPDGNLNNALFWAARAACNDGLSEEECADLLAPEYVQLGGNGGERQALSTIKSAFRNQRRKIG